MQQTVAQGDGAFPMVGVTGKITGDGGVQRGGVAAKKKGHGRGGGGDFAATGHVKHGVDGRGLVDLTGGGGLIRVGQVADGKTQQGAVGVAHQGDGPGENMVVDALLEHVDGVAPGVGGGGVGEDQEETKTGQHFYNHLIF